jgi:hypothetical protein
MAGLAHSRQQQLPGQKLGGEETPPTSTRSISHLKPEQSRAEENSRGDAEVPPNQTKVQSFADKW